MSDYIVQKKLGWYLKLRVPKDLQKHFLTSKNKPKEYLEQTLRTRDRLEAKKRARQLVAMYELEFENLRKEEQPLSVLGSIDKHLVQKYRAYVNGDIEYPFGEFDPDEFWSIAMEHIGQLSSDKEKQTLESLWRSFQNPESLTLVELIDKYLAEKSSVIREASWNERKSELDEFASWLGGSSPISQISKKSAGEYVEYLLKKVSKKTKRRLSTKTVTDTLSGISSMFNWAESRGLSQTNPFQGMAASVPKRSIGKRDMKEWGPDSIKRFLEEAKKDRRVLEVFAIGLFTGMRGREIAELKADSPSERFLQIDEAKNLNSIREVPVHPVIQPLISKLRAEAGKDKYLIKGLTVSQPDNNRYKNIGKKMGRMRAKLGLSGEVDFHSTRRAVAGACERAGMDQDRAARVTGHKPNGITFAVYSDGLSAQLALEEVSKIQYGSGVEESIMEALREVSGVDYG